MMRKGFLASFPFNKGTGSLNEIHTQSTRDAFEFWRKKSLLFDYAAKMDGEGEAGSVFI